MKPDFFYVYATTLAYVAHITLKFSQPTKYTKHNSVELFNQSAPCYFTLYSEVYPAAMSAL